jgi:hypothetical protein
VAGQPAWSGSASKLLDTIDNPYGADRYWPKTPAKLASQLRRLAPALEKVGVRISFRRYAYSRSITIEKIAS